MAKRIELSPIILKQARLAKYPGGRVHIGFGPSIGRALHDVSPFWHVEVRSGGKTALVPALGSGPGVLVLQHKPQSGCYAIEFRRGARPEAFDNIRGGSFGKLPVELDFFEGGVVHVHSPSPKERTHAALRGSVDRLARLKVEGRLRQQEDRQLELF